MKRIPASMKRAKEGWEHIPLVKLGELLKQMIWFSGDYELNITRPVYELNKSDDDDDYWVPKKASLEMDYRKHHIIIKIIWQIPNPYSRPHSRPQNNLSHTNRFAIGIEEPYDDTFQIRRWRVPNEIRYKYSRYYTGAIDKIENLISHAEEFINKEIADEEEVLKQMRETRATKEELCKRLDVKITSENTELFYREKAKYCLHFQLSESGLYEIGLMGGEYTEAEIKKLIELVGGNPRAIAERLSR